MNDKNYEVLTNIIGAVESGGQVYGKRNYKVYGEPYKTTPNEHTITLGWACNYGANARKLMKLIRQKDPAAWDAIDKSGSIKDMLSKDWVALKWKPTAAQKKIIIALIDSPAGHAAQDELFIEDMKKFVADCVKDYPEAGIPAQMMYCEIRHLGGKSAANRIFKRCKKDYSLDRILASLVADQDDTSSANQVGDKIFWSRHLKCRQWVDRYADPEEPEEKKEVKAMPKYNGVVIGSARIDENRNATGGAAGDQKQKSTPDYSGEVSLQAWYLHTKGWVVIRAKDPAARERIAQDMEYICDNPNVGYNQADNMSLYAASKPYNFDVSKVKKKCNTDCAKAIRVCVLYAGIDCGDFYTENEVDTLRKTGQFEILKADKYCKKSDYLLRGDILCTKTKGHTVVVLSNGAKAGGSEPAPEPSGNVAEYQKFLNTYYPEQVKAVTGALLAIDNSYGTKTRNASVSVWKLMANKYYHATLTVDNTNFLSYCKLIAERMTLETIETHPTLKKILQGVLAGRGYYKGDIDGEIGTQTRQALANFRIRNGMSAEARLTAETWNKLFN